MRIKAQTTLILLLMIAFLFSSCTPDRFLAIDPGIYELDFTDPNMAKPSIIRRLIIEPDTQQVTLRLVNGDHLTFDYLERPQKDWKSGCPGNLFSYRMEIWDLDPSSKDSKLMNIKQPILVRNCPREPYTLVLRGDTEFTSLTACSAMERCLLFAPTSSVNPLSESDQAIVTFETFFALLNSGNYNEASELYGGDWEVLRDNNWSLDPDDLAGLLRNACEVNGYQCLEVRSIVEIEKVSDDAFLITANFFTEDGSLFQRGPCCGASETDEPTQTEFQFRVKRTENGFFLVMDLPVYVP